MASIYLYKFNNYYNRQVKRVIPSTTAVGDIKFVSNGDMVSAGAVQVYNKSDTNIHYTDGVNCEVILNYDTWANDGADYALIVDNNDVVNGKSSLWFIMEAQRTRNGQSRFLLYRDLINTYYDEIVNAPMFIEKATLQNTDDLIFNSENMTFNQIKTSEYVLSESSLGVGCLVAYMGSKNASGESFPGGQKTFEVGFNTTQIPKTPDIIYSGSYSDFETKYQGCRTLTSYEIWTDFRNRGPYGPKYRAKYNAEYEMLLNESDMGTPTFSDDNKYHINPSTSSQDPTQCRWTAALNRIGQTNLKTMIVSNLGYAKLSNPDVENTVQTIQNYANKTIKFSNGDLYRIESVNVTNTEGGLFTINESSNLGSSIYAALSSLNYVFYTKGNPNRMNVKVSRATFVARKIDAYQTIKVSYKYNMPSNTPDLIDAPYKMIVCPVQLEENFFSEDNNMHCAINNILYTQKLEVAKGFMNSLTKEFGSWVYDIQVLPYIPNDICNNIYTDDSLLNTANCGQRASDTFLTIEENKSGGLTHGVALFGTESTFKKNISMNYGRGISISNYKIESQTDMCRLVSPNFASAYEFNAAKNGGVRNFEVLCTYKPYNPYINIKPIWGRLYKSKYGTQFVDNRGLVCADDFSLPVITDQWIEYELANKNYEKSFNRQIQNMEVNNSVANTNAQIKALAGTVQGTVSGATAGAMAGSAAGPYGAAAGAVIGGVGGGIASGMAGAADIAQQKVLQTETINYAIDQFGYQLGNIKALPSVLSKTGSSVANSKYFPILEVYTCTDKEKEALQNKIKYNGMSVGVIGKMSDYIYVEPTYIKGKLIRLENTSLDFHEVNTIAEELNKGVFI